MPIKCFVTDFSDPNHPPGRFSTLRPLPNLAPHTPDLHMRMGVRTLWCVTYYTRHEEGATSRSTHELQFKHV